MPQSRREHGLARVLAHQVERHHRDVPDPVGDGAQQHLVFEIVGRGLGDAEEAELSPFLLLQQRRCDHVAHIVVAGGRHGVELEHIDAVDAEFAQRVVEAGDDALRRIALAAAEHRRLGGDHHPIARHALDRLADHALGVIGRGGVEQVHAVVESRMDDRDGAGLGAAGVQPQPAETAAAEAGDADLEFRPAQRGVFHALVGPQKVQANVPVAGRNSASKMVAAPIIPHTAASRCPGTRTEARMRYQRGKASQDHSRGRVMAKCGICERPARGPASLRSIAGVDPQPLPFWAGRNNQVPRPDCVR